jgi:antitoxin component YwqK of YwqJK toxin-antitoxin module
MNAKLIKNYYSNGNIKSQGYYDGLTPIGNHTSWHENGNKKYESIELTDSIDKITEWHSNGTIKSQGCCKDYWKTGLWREWFDNEIKESEGLYNGEDDIKEGVWKFWNREGNLNKTIKYNNL